MDIKHTEAPMHFNYIEGSMHKTCDNIYIYLKFYGGNVINTHQFLKYNKNTHNLNKLNALVC